MAHGVRQTRPTACPGGQVCGNRHDDGCAKSQLVSPNPKGGQPHAGLAQLTQNGPGLSRRQSSLLERRPQVRKGQVTLAAAALDQVVQTLQTNQDKDDADIAILFIETSGCLPMCGHGTIGLVATLAHLGRIALETLEIYAPIADRLGMGSVKRELEGGWFQWIAIPLLMLVVAPILGKFDDKLP